MEKLFWNGLAVLLFAAVLVFVVLFLAGCTPDSPDARFVWGIKAFNVEGPSYSRILNLDKEKRPGRCETDFAACFIYADGTPVLSGGMRFYNPTGKAEYYQVHGSGPNYWVPTDGAGTESPLITDDSGYCVFTSWCTHWGVRMLNTTFSTGGKRTPPIVVAKAVYENRYDSISGQLIPWYGRDQQYPGVLGGHYNSGGYGQFTSISNSTIRPVRPASSRNNLSEDETTFLDDVSFAMDSPYEVVSAVWQRRVGQPGEGYSVLAEHLTLLDHSDASTITYYATPYYLSLSIALAEPVAFNPVGLPLPADLRVGAVRLSEINFNITQVSDDGKRLIVKSDYIVPIDYRDYEADEVPVSIYDRWSCADDPNDPAINLYAPLFWQVDDPNHVVYDPNHIDHNNVILNRLDPARFVPVHCVPLNEGETLNIRATDRTLLPLMTYFLEYWLDELPVLDANRDGIVNLEDVMLYLR